MIQHFRRNWVHRHPSVSETSIPLSVVVQTTLSSVFFVTLRLSSLQMAGLTVWSLCHPVAVPVQLMGVLATTVLADRSAVTYLRLRRS